jgi:CubicO group peptidase (beta-lactamase class C family)
VPAVGVGLIENGQIKYIKVFGELQKGIKAPDNTIFCVASITKTIVAMLTLKLVDAGQWDLNEPLYHYWIDPDVANDSLLKKLTTRHVLSHQTGFPNHRKGKLAFEFEPGTDYQYSGEGFVYLAKALEQKFNKSLGQLSDSLLFKPLGMKDTRYGWDENMDESRFAHAHDSKGNIYSWSSPKIGKSGAAGAKGSLSTTIEDYCKFSIDVINGAGISTEIYNDMISPHAKIKEHYTNGLGWELISDLSGGEYALEHGGSNEGYKTMVIILPKSKRAVIVFTNGDNGISVSNNVIKESIDVGQNIIEYMRGPNNHKAIAVSNAVLEKYAGDYHVDIHGMNFTLVKGDSVLILSGDGMPTTNLYPEAENKFFIKEANVQIEFNEAGVLSLIEEGKVAWTAKKVKK